MTFEEKMNLLDEQEFEGVALEYSFDSRWVSFTYNWDTCDFIDANGRHISLNTLLNYKIRRVA